MCWRDPLRKVDGRNHVVSIPAEIFTTRLAPRRLASWATSSLTATTASAFARNASTMPANCG